MKIHPLLPPKKRTILSEPHRFMARQKKLRRLPHIFARVLELPFNSDADVLVEENPNFFRFVIITNDVDDDVKAHTIEIHPGVMKIVIGGSNVLELSLNELELDLWRFRLPSSTRPELTSVVYVDGKLIVTVPKGANSGNSNYGNQEVDEEGIWRDGNGDLKGRVGRFVLVQ